MVGLYNRVRNEGPVRRQTGYVLSRRHRRHLASTKVYRLMYVAFPQLPQSHYVTARWQGSNPHRDPQRNNHYATAKCRPVKHVPEIVFSRLKFLECVSRP